MSEVALLEPQVEVEETPVEVAPETPEVEAVAAEEVNPLASYEAELGITEAAPESPQSSTPAEPPAEVLAAAEAIRQREREEERRQREENGLLSDYRSRRDRLAGHLAEVQAGRQQLNMAAILTEFDRHNGQAAEVTRRLSARQYSDSVYKAADELVKDFSKDKAKHADTPALLKDLVSRAREGYSTKADVDKAVKAANQTLYNKLAKDPAALRALLSKLEGSTGSGDGASTLSGTVTKDMAETMPIAQLMKLRAQGKI
jgi:hypothetical protein